VVTDSGQWTCVLNKKKLVPDEDQANTHTYPQATAAACSAQTACSPCLQHLVPHCTWWSVTVSEHTITRRNQAP
jgi:hypothetical protein